MFRNDALATFLALAIGCGGRSGLRGDPRASDGGVDAMATADRPDVAVTADVADSVADASIAICDGSPETQSWTPVASGTALDLHGIWGSGRNDVWAVAGNRDPRPGGIVLRWSGTAWISAGAPMINDGRGGEPFYGVWGTGADDVWVVGLERFASEPSPILHWNGSAWSRADRPGFGLLAVWGSGRDDAWAVGPYGEIERWNGANWASQMTVAQTVFFRNQLGGIWGSGATDVWAVGTPREDSAIIHWNGSTWSSVPSGITTMQGLHAVWGSAPNDVWGVGSVGTIVRWNGSAWSIVASGTRNDLNAVWGCGPNDIWAVGATGTMLRWNGSAWSSVPSGTIAALNSVWGSGPNDVWTVGDGGVIIHQGP